MGLKQVLHAVTDEVLATVKLWFKGDKIRVSCCANCNHSSSLDGIYECHKMMKSVLTEPDIICYWYE